MPPAANIPQGILENQKSGTRDNVRQGTAQVGRNVWLPILLSSAQRKLLLWEILKVLSLTEQMTAAGRMAVSPALLAFVTAQRLLLRIAWARQLNFNSKMWQK